MDLTYSLGEFADYDGDGLQAFYSSIANTDDGSCITPVFGCLNPLAINYNPYANLNDGSCIAVAYGCTDPLAINYMPNATVDDILSFMVAFQ